MSFEVSLEDAELQAPHHHRLVLGSGADELAVWREVNAGDDCRVIFERLRKLGRVEEPNLDSSLDGNGSHG